MPDDLVSVRYIVDDIDAAIDNGTHLIVEDIATEVERLRAADQPVGLGTVLREWGRIGCIGFGGPPTHIALLREL